MKEIVNIAKNRKTGARALRAVIEEAMLDIMFEVPSMTDIDTCIITDDVIKDTAAPIFKLLKKQTA